MNVVAIVLSVIGGCVFLSFVFFALYALAHSSWKTRIKPPERIKPPKRAKTSEELVSDLFDDMLDGTKRMRFQNLILPGDRKHPDRTVEIDTLLVCHKGVLVIETKSWCGEVYGDDESPYWIIHYDSGEEYRRYNPVKQNEAHVNRVREILRERGIKCHPIPYIVFFQGDISNVDSDICFTYGGSDLENDFQALEDVLNDAEIERISAYFSYFAEHPACSPEEHIEHVKSAADKNNSGFDID